MRRMSSGKLYKISEICFNRKKRNKGGLVIYRKIEREYKRLNQQCIAIKKKLRYLPEGKLVLCSNGRGGSKWFRSDGHTKEYIKKKDIALAQKLAYKKFLTVQLEEIEHEMRALKFYLRHHLQDIPKSDQLISESEEFQKLLSVYFTPLEQKHNNWMHEPYEKNKLYPLQLIHKTCTKERVRSKSEAYIYNCLYKNKIPFRYECELQLGELTYYPDFTIIHPKTGEVYYWEHFGRMDKSDYAQKAYNKLNTFQMYEIIPMVNLVMTFETKEHPLSFDVVDRLVAEYFL